ncbi:hypothetical protein Peur_041807 [Populus x canadensis]
MTGSLPLDIISHILSRLPVKSLLRFKCVSKSWCSLISYPQFNRMNLNVAIADSYVKHQRQRLILISPSFHSLYPVQYSLKKWGFDDFTFIGPCNGLICVSCDLDTVLLFNPCTKESMIIPKVRRDCAFSKCFSVHINQKSFKNYKETRNLSRIKTQLCHYRFLYPIFSPRHTVHVIHNNPPAVSMNPFGLLDDTTGSPDDDNYSLPVVSSSSPNWFMRLGFLVVRYDNHKALIQIGVKVAWGRGADSQPSKSNQHQRRTLPVSVPPPPRPP